MTAPIPCGFCCDEEPEVVPIIVNYRTPKRKGFHQMYRVQCKCGAIGKCRPDAGSAAEAWNEPWQALPPKVGKS